MSELTPMQRQCLAAVRAHPGRTPSELPGGLRTVRALMRRELVERGPRSWAIFTPAHDHHFKSTMHMDGCHWYSTAGACSCGATIAIHGERNPREDPYAEVWMDETAGGDECSRCKQLRAGARVAPFAVEIVGPRRRIEAVA